MGARVDGPHDWDHLPDPADWANCGHALIYVPDATREDVLKGVRFSSLVSMAGPGSSGEAGERINKRRAVVMATRLARQAGFESIDASEFFSRTDRLAIATRFCSIWVTPTGQM
ncbi:hypothetical protein Mgrana_02452 [Meiothermus granaticius NBRC 107808]|uniref:Uncharacterized protein n=1 Tax=Meiothermus granaticius NBRC 107808 TaxID=1227551 RepID=A0A399F9Q6_9DEIN|nr:hypothetical protein Mgrana_02452 [Meiothermus granaticius NBRC 107808]